MRVILRDDVEHLGKKGDLLVVADGYARNYLIPRGLAMLANTGAAKQAEAMRRSREVREQREREEAQEFAARLAGTPVSVSVRAGEAGRLFGSVTAADIAQAVSAATGSELDRRVIRLEEPIKALGSYEVPARLHADVEVTLNVEVVAS